jgi:hypothetical protein
MPRTLVNTFRSLFDPLRNRRTADRWIASLPAVDPLATRKKVLEVVGPFIRGADVRPSRIEALLKVDACVDTLVEELTRHYTAVYDKDTEVELRSWQAVFDVIKAFVSAYQGAWHGGHARYEDKSWRAVLPSLLIRFAHYKGLDGKFRLFRFSRWTPAQWRAFHDIYESARTRGWHAEKPELLESLFARRVSVEHEYITTLLLMRLDSGNFTADQVEWIATELDHWSPALTLITQPQPQTGFLVDLSSDQGLRRRDGAYRNRRMLFLDATPVHKRIVERMNSLPQEAESDARADELPVREQRLVLNRLATLFGPEAFAAARAERVAVDNDVRVVIGFRPLCNAIGDADARESLHDDAAIARQVAEIGAAIAATESFRDKVLGATWKMTDRSATGCRLTAPIKGKTVRLGDLVAVKERDLWLLGVVRRMQRHEADLVTIGVEIIAQRFARVLLRPWTAEGVSNEQPYFGIYLPDNEEDHRAPPRSLIGPEAQLLNGAMADLHMARGHYLVRVTETLECQQGWSRSLFTAVRKL